MKQSIESKAAQTILQLPNKVKIGNKIYKVAPPCAATIILASEKISQLPAIKLDPSDILLQTLAIAKDCRPIGEAIAILILGAKNLSSEKEIIKKKFFGLKKERIKITIDNVANLSKEILENVEPRDLSKGLAELFSMSQIAFFFATITSLTEINLLRKTKMTASGQ